MPKFLHDGHFSGSTIDLTLDGQLFLSSYTSSPAAPTISFDSNAGGIWYESDSDALHFRASGGNRAYISSAGIISQANVYTAASGQFRNYSGVWAGTTGIAGNGFYFLNTADGNTTKAMDLSSGGNATFAGTISSGDITIEHADTPKILLKDTTNDLTARFKVANAYAYLSVDSSNSVGSSRLVFQVDGSSALHLDSSLNATFGGDVTLASDKKVNFGASSYIEGATSGTKLMLRSSDDMIFQPGNSTKVTFKANGNATFAGEVSGIHDLYAYKLYDSQNTSYFADLGNTGTSLNVAGNITANGDGSFGTSGATNNSSVKTLDGSIITKIQSQTAGDTAGILGTESNNVLRLVTNNISALTIDTSQNVGIGTTGPSAKFEVKAKGSALGSTGYFINSLFKDIGQNVGIVTAHNDTDNGVGVIAGINSLAFVTYGSDWTQALLLDTSQNATFAGDVTVTGGQVFLGGTTYAIENVNNNYGIRNANGNYGGSDGTNAYSTPQDFFHIPGTVRIGAKYATSDRDHIRIVPSGTTSTLEMPNENAIIHNNQGNIVLRTGSSTDAVTVTGANTTFAGNVTVTGDLVVNGTQTILNTQTVEVEDNILQLNTTQGSPDTATATTSGISVYRGNGITQASLIFDDSDDTWDLTNNLVVAGNISLADSGTARFGDSSDLQIYHNGTDSVINNDTGDLYITNKADDKDIIFRSDNGSGGYIEYFKVDGGAEAIIVSKTLRAIDNVRIDVGSATDGRFYHDGTDTHLATLTGDLKIRNSNDDGDIIFFSDDGSGGTTQYFKLDGSHTRTTFAKDIKLEDNVKILGGTGEDLQIYHDGSNSYIQDVGTGDLYIQTNGTNMFLRDSASGNTFVAMNIGTADVSLKQGGNTKLTTTSSGVTVTGNLVMGSGQVKFADTGKLMLGDSNDLKIYHNGTNSEITHDNTGDLLFKTYVNNMQFINYADDKDIIFQSDNGSGGTTTYFKVDGGSENVQFAKSLFLYDNVFLNIGGSFDLRLYHDGNSNIKAQGAGNLIISQTVDDADIIFKSDNGSGGVTEYFRLDGGATKMVASKDLHFADNVKAMFGNTSGTSDLKIYHDGSNSYIQDSGTGDIRIASNIVHLNNAASTEVMLKAIENGAVELYHNDNKKFETTSTGVSVTGGATFSGNILINGNTAITSGRNFYGTIFYDADNTGYYANPAGTSIFNSITLSSFNMDGNTISGIDDSGEFTDNDSHIMTSAAVRDKFGFAYFISTSGDYDDFTRGIQRATGGSNGPSSTSHATGFTLLQDDNNYGFQLFSTGSGDNSEGLKYRYKNTTYGNWQTIVTKTFGDGRYLKLSGGKLTGNLEIEKQYPVIVLDDSNATTPTNAIAYISYQINGSEKAWTGWGSNSTNDFTINAGAGSDLILRSNNSVAVTFDSSQNATFAGNINVDNGKSVFAAAFYERTNTNYLVDPAGASNIATITSTGITISNQNPSLNFTDSSGSTYSAQWRFKDNDLQYLWGGGIKAYFTTAGIGIGDNGTTADARIERTGSSPYGLTFKTNNTSALSLDSSQNATFSGNVTLGSYRLLHINHEIRVGTNIGATNETGIIKQGGSSYGVGIFTWGDSAPVQIGGGSVLIQKESGAATNLTVSGDVSIAEKLIHSGDTNTYLQFPGTNDKIVFATNGSDALTLDAANAATFAGDVQAPGIYVGSTNTSFDFYNNGTSYLNGAVTIDHNLDMTSNGVIKMGGTEVISATRGISASTGTFTGNVTAPRLALGGYSLSSGENLRVGGIRGGLANELIHLYNRVNIGYPSGWGGQTAPNYGLSTYGSVELATNTGFTTSGGSMRAPIFYDSGNTAYFIDPSTANSVVHTGFKINAPDEGGSPAMTAILNMHGYEGRGVGIKMRDSVNSASNANNREWFVGTGYASSGFNIGYASDGSASSYSAQAKLTIDTSGNATFAGSVTATSFSGDGSNLTNITTSAPSNMVTTNTTQTISGAKTFSSTPVIAGTSASEGGEIRFGAPTTTGGSFHLDNYQGNFRVHTLATGKRFQIVGADGTGTQLYGNKIEANQFVEAGNTTYYLDPGNTSTSLNVAGGGTFQGNVIIDTNGGTDNYYLTFSESGSNRFTIYENSNNVYFNGWAGHTIFRPQMGGSGSFAVYGGNTQFDTSGNATFAGTSITLDSAGSADYIADRINTSSGATYQYKTNGTLKWYHGLRGLANDDFYLFNNTASANALIITASGSNATFAGRVKGTNFTSTENAASGGFPASRDYLLAGTGDRGGGLVINDVSGAKHALYAGAYDLTFAKETNNGSGTVSYDMWMRANASSAAGNVTSLEFFKDAIFAGSLTIPSYIYHSGDTNTYFGFNGADQWKLRLGGGDRLVTTTSQFTSNLNVVINSSATYALAVDGSISTDQYIAFLPSGVSGSPDMTIDVTSNVMTFSDVSGGGYADFNVDSIRAELYYDRDNTSYYLNPSASVSLNVAGTGSFGGNVSHQGLTMTTGTDVDQVKEFSQTFQLTANTWTDTTVVGSQLNTGTYAMQVHVDDYSAGGNHYDEIYSAMISWYGSSTNSTHTDEIVVHRAGHAPNNGDVQFRTQRASATDTHDLMLQVKHNLSYNQALNGTTGKRMIFKFRRLI